MKSGLAVALFVSLAVNIFLGGFVAGRMLAGPHGFMDGPGKFAAFSDHKKDGRKGPGRGAFFDGALMFPAIEALPPEKRELFKENFEASRDVLRANRTALIEKREAFTEALTAEPWDRAKAEAALVDLRTAADAQEATLSKLLIDVFEKLSPEERKALVTATTERDRRWKDGPRRRSFKGGPGDRPGPDGFGGPGGDDMGPPPPPPGFGDGMEDGGPDSEDEPAPREE